MPYLLLTERGKKKREKEMAMELFSQGRHTLLAVLH
jgi:hypothetical protein